MERDENSESKFVKALEWAYDKAVNGIGGMGSSVQMAEDYRRSGSTPYEQANALIRWQNTKAATSGFVTGLGGLITMPVTLPANIVSVLYVQVRMIAAIAHLGGYDVRDDRVKTMVFSCVVASSAKDVMKNMGIAVGNKVAMNALRNMSGKVLLDINKKVGLRLVTKFGEKGVVNLVKVVPILGGVIGATVDGISTNAVGNVARDVFTPFEGANPTMVT